MADKLSLSVMKNISDLATDKKKYKKKEKEKEIKEISMNIGKSEETILKNILLKNKKVNLNQLKNNLQNESENDEIANAKINNLINNIDGKPSNKFKPKITKANINNTVQDKSNKKMISLKELSK